MHSGVWANLFYTADWTIRIVLWVRVIMRRRPVGVSLAWLTVILSFPFIGAAIYLMFGELRLGQTRARRARAIHVPYEAWLESLRHRYPFRADDGVPTSPVMQLVDAGAGYPPLPGNALELLDDADAVFDALIADIEAAEHSVELEFYIWSAGGRVDDVGHALARAATRGVTCRVLLDAVGSAAFFRGDGAEWLRRVGVDVRAALPVAAWRLPFQRFDLRLHRKIAVIDRHTAYTGSLNLADPRFFKQGAGVGRWVDAMVRVRGPAVEALAVTLLEGWELETGAGLEALLDSGPLPDQPRLGPAVVQVIPSGPDARYDAVEAVLLQTIYAARSELVLTSPYFVPEEPLLLALASAAARGVAVHLIVPAKNDSKLVDLASRAFEGDLAQAGVKIWLFDGGLLHTKSICVDGRFALFGSLNLDPRSLYLNFEISLAVHDPAFVAELRALQQTYLDQSTPFDLEAWTRRPFGRRLAENAARLAGPLL